MDSFPAAALPFAPLAALFEVQCKNAAAFTSAHQVLVDGLTTLAQQQGALLRTTVDDCSRATGDVLAVASFEERTTKQAEAARQVYVSTFDRLRELSETAVRTNVAALDILNARVAEAFDDLTALLAQPAAPAANAASNALVPVAVADDADAAEEEEEAEEATAAAVEAEPVRKPRPRPTKHGRRSASRG